MSTARFASASYTKNMGYEILRLHGALCKGKIGAEEVQGTAYFQKVCVQAPSPPWFWGMLHFDDGSYLDWFIPHLSPTSRQRILWHGRREIYLIGHFRRADCFMTPSINALKYSQT